MFEVVETDIFAKWLGGLRDRTARAVIARRILRLSNGNFGDARSVGDGVSELRIHSGPGYRVYFTRRGDRLILLLCGGDKNSQDRDINAAKALARRPL